MANQLTKNVTLKSYVQSMQGEIAKALPSVLTPERFTRMALSAISNNKALENCTPQSFLGAMMNAAQLGLEPNTPLGQAYLIPYGNQCQFQIGYVGLLNLAYRNEEMQTINAQVVYENDEFNYELGLDPKLQHKPARGDRGKAICYYAYYKLKNGGYGFEVMSVDDINKHMEKFSKSANSSSSPWKTDYDSMAKKTVLKKVLKYAPLKSDFVRSITEDESIKTNISNNMSEIRNEVFEAEVEEKQEVNQTAETSNSPVPNNIPTTEAKNSLY